MAEGSTDAAVALHRLDGGCAIHLIRYDYDEDADRVPALDLLVLDVRLPFDIGDVEAFSPGGELTITRIGRRRRPPHPSAGSGIWDRWLPRSS